MAAAISVATSGCLLAERGTSLAALACDSAGRVPGEGRRQYENRVPAGDGQLRVGAELDGLPANGPWPMDREG